MVHTSTSFFFIKMQIQVFKLGNCGGGREEALEFNEKSKTFAGN